jgi:hypothetical protein
MTMRQLARFFAYKPLLSWGRAFTTATLPGFSVYNSLMGLIETAVYGRQIDRLTIDKPPLFVIGHWRSGTTLLHNLLAQDPQFTFPNMYQVLFPNHFLVTETVTTKLTASLVPRTRPMDNLPAGWKIPQEEDIGLAIQTCLSPYMLMADPDRDDKVRRLWDLQMITPEEKKLWQREYTRFVKKVTLRDPQRRQLVLKSPVNTLRIPALLELYPDAKFVYIYRNPFDVFNSAVHLRRTMFRENSLGFPVLRDIEDSIYWVMEFTSRTYNRDKALLPPGRLHEVRYEDLEQDPVGGLEQIYSTLNLDGFERLREIVEPQVPELKRFKKNEYKYDRAKMDEAYERLRYLFDVYGYPHPAEQYETVAA